MIQAKALGIYALTAILGIAGGKLEPDIPWWVVFAGVILASCVIGTLTMHGRRDDAPLTLGDLKEQFAARDLELKSVRETIDGLDMEPLGTDGTEWAPLPDGTNAVKLPDGTIRLATPARVGGIGVGAFLGSPTVYSGEAPPEDQS